MSQKKQHNSAILAQNKKAFAEYEVLEKLEAGLVLSGAEVKSIRLSQANLKGSFIEVVAKNRAIHLQGDPSQKPPSGKKSTTKKQARPNMNASTPIHVRFEAFIRKMHVSPYKQAPNSTESPDRRRKLLLNKKEIMDLYTKLSTKGITIIPLDLHLSHNHIKMTIGVCRSKKKQDRREELKKKAQNLEIRRTLRKF